MGDNHIFLLVICFCVSCFRLFAPSGQCAACNRSIPAYEQVMTVTQGRVYHLECFKCSQCEKSFTVGDKYFLVNNNIVCEDH